MASSNQYASKGEAVTLTCAYTHPPGLDVTPTITWTKEGTDLTTGITTPSTGVSLFTVASAAFTDNAEYACKADFGKHGAVSGTGLKQYVRGILAQSVAYRKLVGRDIRLDCVAYGDDAGTGTWTKSGSALTDSRYSDSTATYSATTYSRTSTLTISTSVAADSATLTCSYSYATSPQTVSSNFEIVVLGKRSLFT